MYIIDSLTQEKFAPNIAGQWLGSWSTTDGAGGVSGTLAQTGSTISGTTTITNTDFGDIADWPVSGTISGKTVSFKGSTTYGGYKLTINFTSGIVSADELRIENGIYRFYVNGKLYDSGTFYLEKE